MPKAKRVSSFSTNGGLINTNSKRLRTYQRNLSQNISWYLTHLLQLFPKIINFYSISDLTCLLLGVLYCHFSLINNDGLKLHPTFISNIRETESFLPKHYLEQSVSKLSAPKTQSVPKSCLFHHQTNQIYLLKVQKEEYYSLVSLELTNRPPWSNPLNILISVTLFELNSSLCVILIDRHWWIINAKK